MTMGLSGLQPVSQRPEALPPMIEALIRVLVEALGLPLVQGLGYLFLHGLRLWRDPSETACTVIGLLGWGGITLAVLAWLGTPYQRAVRRVPSARFGRQCRGDTGGGIARMSRITAALAAVAMLAACAADGGDRVHLRIRNSSPFVFSHVWQGFPQRWTDHDFGRLAPCQTSHWHGFPAQLPHYRKTRVQLEHGRQYVDTIDPMRWVGQPELPPGYYTLDYAWAVDGLRLHLIAQSRPDDSDSGSRRCPGSTSLRVPAGADAPNSRIGAWGGRVALRIGWNQKERGNA